MTRPRCYLGLACTGHDGALALVDDRGEVVFAEATERPLQQKRAPLVPPDDPFRVRALFEEHCPPDAEIVLAKSWSDDAGSRFMDVERRAAAQQRMVARFDRSGFGVESLETFRYLLRVGAGQMALAGTTAAAVLRRERGQAEVELRGYDHHLTHAAAACLTGPFERAACLVADGLGERGSTRAFAFDRGRLEPLDHALPEDDSIGSLGFFFMEVCVLCGFDPAAGEEWKVMGLAAHGRRDPRIHALMRRTVEVDGLRVVRPMGALEAGAELRRLRRPPGAPVMDAADLAHTGQLVFCELMEELLGALHARGVSENLVLGGGCALNSAFNGRALERTGFDALHVFCAPADDGNAVGAALLAWREDHPEATWTPRASNPYLGSRISADAVEAVAAGGAFDVERLAPAALAQRAAEMLDEGRIIGWVQGRAELGPRALGNRSILADPRRADMKDRINATIKHREAFRPFAPAILHEHGGAWFVDYRYAPHMERALRFRDEMRERVPAVVHADGTGRVQSVTEASNPRFFALLTAFFERTGVPLLLNTSLNVMGKPIVHSVEDAIALFATTPLDALFLDDHLVLARGAER